MQNSYIAYPVHFDSRGRTAVTDYNTHVRDMLEQLLFTNPGERVNRPDFGSGLQQLVFAPNSPELAAALQYTLKAAVQRWLGDVLELQALDVTSDDSTLSIVIAYIVKQTNERQVAQFTQTV
ncbi:MAG: GPW/gp25 family protein [Ktedonobacteraceae bacterium]